MASRLLILQAFAALTLTTLGIGCSAEVTSDEAVAPQSEPIKIAYGPGTLPSRLWQHYGSNLMIEATAGQVEHVEGSIRLPQRLRPVGTQSKEDFVYYTKNCSPGYGYMCGGYHTLPPSEVEARYGDKGFVLLHSERINYYYGGYLSAPGYDVRNLTVSYDEAQNEFDYSFDFVAKTDISFNPYRQLEYGILVNGVEQDSYWALRIPFAFDSETKTIEVPEAGAEGGIDWVDAHYRINQGPLLNYRMQPQAGVFTHLMAEPLKTGDTLDVFFTYSATGPAFDTPAYDSITVGNVPLETAVHVYEQADVVTVNAVAPWVALDWVVLHYTFNGAAYNVNMQPGQEPGVWYHQLPAAFSSYQELSDYWLSYSSQGRARDAHSGDFYGVIHP